MLIVFFYRDQKWNSCCVVLYVVLLGREGKGGGGAPTLKGFYKCCSEHTAGWRRKKRMCVEFIFPSLTSWSPPSFVVFFFSMVFIYRNLSASFS